MICVGRRRNFPQFRLTHVSRRRLECIPPGGLLIATARSLPSVPKEPSENSRVAQAPGPHQVHTPRQGQRTYTPTAQLRADPPPSLWDRKAPCKTFVFVPEPPCTIVSCRSGGALPTILALHLWVAFGE